MGRRRTRHKSLPPKLKPVGRSWYYDHGIVDGKRKITALGPDYQQALIKWAELSGQSLNHGRTLDDAIRRYRIEVLPGKAPATQDQYARCLTKLSAVLGAMALDKITAYVAEEYFDRRSLKGGKHAAARDIAVLSAVFNYARRWGFTNAANPRRGKHLPTAKRRAYVTDDQFRAIYDHGDETLRDAMDLAYLTGQRPSDVLKIARTDIRDGFIEVRPAKTAKSSGARIRIQIAGELESVLKRILERPRAITSMRLFQQPNGNAVTLQMIQRRWVRAREAAGIPPSEAQFRDLRAKAATDLNDLAHAQTLLAHTTRNTTEGYVRGRVGEKVKPLNRKVK